MDQVECEHTPSIFASCFPVFKSVNKASSPSVVLTGFDEPDVQLTITLKNQKEYTLQIGKTAKSDQRYGSLRTGLGTIFLLKADVVDKLKKTVEDLRVSPDGA